MLEEFKLLKLSLCSVWTQCMLHGLCHGRDLNSTLSTSNHSDFTGCLQGYTAYISDLLLYYTGAITFSFFFF